MPTRAQRYRVTTSEQHGPKIAELATYGDALRAYEFDEEAKCAGPDGKACTKQTVGLLSRRHVRIGAVHLIGKESNLLEEVEAGPSPRPPGDLHLHSSLRCAKTPRPAANGGFKLYSSTAARRASHGAAAERILSWGRPYGLGA